MFVIELFLQIEENMILLAEIEINIFENVLANKLPWEEPTAVKKPETRMLLFYLINFILLSTDLNIVLNRWSFHTLDEY